MLGPRPTDDHDACIERFAWELPDRFNIAAACCDIHATGQPHATAILDRGPEGGLRRLTFHELKQASDALAAAFVRRGIMRGDRIAILLPQGRDVAIAHMAAYKMGAIALPLAHVFRAEALRYRLLDAEARLLVTDASGLEKLAELRADTVFPALDCIVATEGTGDGVLDFSILIEEDAAGFEVLDTHRDDPCLMIYTSGTTGQPKGALHAMRVLLGHLPGFAYHHQPFERADVLFWTPADWAWAGGLLNLLLPALFYGKPVLASPFAKFNPVAAFDLIVETKVTHAFLPPTALRMMRGVTNRPPHLPLAALTCAGEALGAATYHWARETLSLSADEFYGQTECNYVLGSSERRGVSKAGRMGKPLPGARVIVMNGSGEPCPPGEEGEIAIHRDHPSLFLGYWRQPEATRAKFMGDWLRTGDRAIMDDEGSIAFVARDDDIITSSGYRIGPVEIEDCLLKHEAVALAAVVGLPDALRTEIITAVIVLREGHDGSERLVREIQDFVRSRLSLYEYPRKIVFTDTLPTTTTGKVMRKVLRERVANSQYG